MLFSRFCRLSVALTLGLAMVGCQTIALESGKGQGFIVYPVEKIRPAATPPERQTVVVRAAGNEYEPLLFGIFNNSAGPLSVHSVQVETEVPGISFELFSVQYYHVGEKTRWFDSASINGDWPDPLVPIGTVSNDKLSFEFPRPFSIPPAKNRHFLLDVHFPEGYRTAQTIHGHLILDDGKQFDFSFKLEPFNFDIPRQSSLPTSANINTDAIHLQHGIAAGSEEEKSLIMAYRHQMALHNLAPYYATDKPIPLAHDTQGKAFWDFSYFDSVAGPFLDGSLFPDAPKPGSFWTPDSQGLDPADTNVPPYYTSLQEHLRQKGWLGQAIHFLRDEPLVQEFHLIRSEATAFKAQAPDIPTMLTEPWTSRLASVVDIFCPDIFNLGDGLAWYPLFFRNNYPIAEWQASPNPKIYREKAREGRVNWLYSCNSAQILDMPNVFIDSGAAYQRSISWLIFRYGFEGFLYWHVNAAFTNGGNPWIDQSMVHSQGDGTLFYPGIKGMFWLTENLPLPSLRLKLLREGFEDFEYLKLYEKLAGRSAAFQFSGRGARTSLEWEHNAQRLGQSRLELGRLVEAAFSRVRK